MSIRASEHGDNARRRSNTPFLAFLRNRESRNQLLYAFAQAAVPVALVVGLVMAGAERHDASVLATAQVSPTAVVASGAAPSGALP